MPDEIQPDVAERRYERWVIRVADLVTGNYPEDKEEAEETLLLRLDEGMIGRISPRRYFEPFAPEEMPENPEEYFGEEEEPAKALRSLVFALYLAVGGEDWGLHVEPEGENSPFVRVGAVPIDYPEQYVDIHVDVRSLACEDTDDLRALHQRIVKEIPKRHLTVEQAATEALDTVEEMQAMLEAVREVSDPFDAREEIHDVHETLDNLWTALAGIAAIEEERRLRGDAGARE